MNTSSTENSLHPRPGRTFSIALICLGVVALVQLFAALTKLPINWGAIRLGPQEMPVVSSEPEARQSATPTVTPPEPLQNPADQQRQSMVVQAMEEAARFFRVGDYENALVHFDKAVRLIPEDPLLLYQRAFVLQQLERYDEAEEQYQLILEMPGTPAEIVRLTQLRLEDLDGLAPQANVAATLQSIPLEEEVSAPLRDDIGIQPGATFGIIETKLRPGDNGQQTLSIAIKARQSTDIEVGKMQVTVYFYEQTEEGETVLTEATVTPRWVSSPVNWSENEPEILHVDYNVADSIKIAEADRKFHGYTVGIYYNGDLQDSRSEPNNLEKQFPLRLILSEIQE